MMDVNYREHLDKPAHPLFPPTADGLCHGSIRVLYEAFDSYRHRTVIVSECMLCGKCFANQIPSEGGQQ